MARREVVIRRAVPSEGGALYAKMLARARGRAVYSGEFSEDLAVGQRAEADIAEQLYHKLWKELTDIEAGDGSAYDLRLSFSSGPELWIECKDDLSCIGTGNVAVEVGRVLQGEEVEQSGIAVTQADYVFYRVWHPPEALCLGYFADYFIRTAMLRRIAQRAIDRGKIVPIGEGGRTLGVLLTVEGVASRHWGCLSQYGSRELVLKASPRTRSTPFRFCNLDRASLPSWLCRRLWGTAR